MTKVGNLLIFLRQSSVYVLFKWPRTKFPTTPHWKMHILDSSLNITFLQLSTRYEYFSLVNFNLIFFCFARFFYWQIPFHKSIMSFNSPDILQFSYKYWHFFFHLISRTFFIFKAYCFQLSILTIWYLSWSTGTFDVFFPFPLYLFLSIFLLTTSLIRHTPLWITFLNEFY